MRSRSRSSSVRCSCASGAGRNAVPELGRRFARLLGEPTALDPGQFCTKTTETMEALKVRFFVRCPDCGGTDELDLAKYTVHPHSGLVSPRWHCQSVTCGYLERIQLESLEES